MNAEHPTPNAERRSLNGADGAPRYEVVQGDCREVLRTWAAGSVDAIVTDPPYELGFMGKGWDKSGAAFDVRTWRECLRVLKPGGHLLAFGGTRTHHRIWCAIEDAGFEIRDTLGWLYGSGFPKSRDVSKAIDAEAGAVRPVVGPIEYAGGHVQNNGGTAESGYSGGLTSEGAGVRQATAAVTPGAVAWEGWGTALKPAWEPIVLARKPLAPGVTVAQNVLRHGTGGINVDGCRVGTEDGGRPAREVAPLNPGIQYQGTGMCGREDGSLQSSRAIGITTEGRWPANILHDGSGEAVGVFPEEAGGGALVDPNGGVSDSPTTTEIYGKWAERSAERSAVRHADAGSAARFFYCAKASPADREEGLDEVAPGVLARSCQAQAEAARGNVIEQGAGAFNKARVRRNVHPTVKPVALMRWLVRLITPPGGLVADPFTGSGSTGKGALLEGMRFRGVELTADYLPIIEGRLAHALGERLAEERRPVQGELF